jgi:mannose/fructose/N-acetylgalactosamine-specific phosphotransferase system component IID
VGAPVNGAVGIVLILAGAALGLLLSLLVWGPLNPARRHRDSHRSYHSGTPVLVRAEKRLYQHPGRQPLVHERRVCHGKPPL